MAFLPRLPGSTDLVSPQWRKHCSLFPLTDDVLPGNLLLLIVVYLLPFFSLFLVSERGFLLLTCCYLVAHPVGFLVQEGREALHEARTGETCSCGEDNCCE